MMQVTNSETRTYTLPDGRKYEYEFNYFRKMVYGRLYSQYGGLIAKESQAVWPWTKVLNPEQMLQKLLSKV